MKSIGIVRKVDQLGRIVLPMSLRRKLEIDVSDPMEIFVDGERVVLEKYEPVCLFCGSKKEVFVYKERNICRSCVSELHRSEVR
ncbi:AbrB/MazE/SpoVT family DNA-binding domain-containing protein [Alicyclobacillus tolerans]|uniref:AbrB/MazE/SpoVT family DNA-binding domain-containing protein n=1 Tax=Alicyclobacillus tolerans TaxID=90970 RepID=UPI001F23AAC5|nr:AbrB/MazE/SpoVT family DNA-binding domain-containing protein [Alicyclobacillus tolerans]MCF8565860.1 AbrB/MazE/SpoVT family DNA-binding domain-containing protein [Alicyclobacillus tolerans]